MIYETINTPFATYELTAGIFNSIDRLKNVAQHTKDALKKEFQHKVHEVSSNLKISKEAVVKAYQEPKMANMLEACGYSFATLYGAFSAASNLASNGVMHTLVHVVEHEGLHKAGHSAGHKAKKVDAVLTKYPALKKLAGPALAGVMLYGYACGPTSKSLEAWDMGNIKKALVGDYSVGELLQSSEMVSAAALLATGKAFSLTALAENSSTLAIGLACNAIIHSKNPKLAALGAKLKGSIDKFKSKGTPLEDIAAQKGFSKDASTSTPEQDKSGTKKVNPGWFDAMSEEKQSEYLSEHPNSIYQKKQTASVVQDDGGLKKGVWSGYQVTCEDGTTYKTFTLKGEEIGIRGRSPVTVSPSTLEMFDTKGACGKLKLVAGRNTGVGAGVLFCARDTGRVLFVLRSPNCESPNTWAGLGGGVEQGETIEQGVRREVQEEGGFSDPYDLIHMHSDDQGGFVFHNHFAWVPTEFDPVLNNEHTEHRWCDEMPQPIHPGLLRSILAYQESRK